MLHDLLNPFLRVWADITSGRHAPFAFRFVVQPLVAAFFAYRAARQDSREGRTPYFWALVNESTKRRALLLEGWRHVGKVFILAMIIDAIYQFIALRWFYPGEALMVATLLAVLPYLVLRGPLNRWMRRGKRP